MPDLPYFLLTLKNIFFSGERTNVPNVKSPSLVQFTHLMAKISVKNIIWAKVKVVRNVGKKSLDIWFELTPLPFIQVSWSKFQVSTISSNRICSILWRKLNTFFSTNPIDFDKKHPIKFIYSEKATKILPNLHLFLTGTSTSQKKVEIWQQFCGLLRIYEL